EMRAALSGAQSTLAEIGTVLAGLNAQPGTLVIPPVAQGIQDQGTPIVHTRRAMSMSDQLEVRSILRKKSTAELHALFYEQARQKGPGVSLDEWLTAGGNARVDAFN